MKSRIAAILLILMLVLPFSFSCIQVSGVAPRVEVVILSHKMTTDATGQRVVLVTVKNISYNTAELAEVQVKFYDGQKNLVDYATDSVLNLKPDETWDFTIPCSGSNCGMVVSYEVSVTYGSSVGGF